MEVRETMPKDDIRFVHEGAASQATLRLTLVQARSVGLEVNDALGKPVVQRSTSSLQSGSHDVELELGGLSPGVYFCKVWLDAEPQVFKFVLEEH